MPQHKSSKKRMRQTVKVNARNRMVRSQINTASKKLLAAKGESVAAALNDVYSVIDHAVKAGVIHKNKAANRKSRLALKVKTAAV
ncbi:MAG: 30S ribosomal protein S20 [Chitinispirillales bacterium]|nr:30S ribosomal protein S20 [Chitinispirillales bacterium]